VIVMRPLRLRDVYLVYVRANGGNSERVLAGYSNLPDAMSVVRMIRTNRCFEGETIEFSHDADVGVMTRHFYDHLHG